MKTIELIKQTCEKKKIETIRTLKQRIDFNLDVVKAIKNLDLITSEAEKTKNELKKEINEIINNSKENKQELENKSNSLLIKTFESIISEFL